MLSWPLFINTHISKILPKKILINHKTDLWDSRSKFEKSLMQLKLIKIHTYYLNRKNILLAAVKKMSVFISALVTIEVRNKTKRFAIKCFVKSSGLSMMTLSNSSSSIAPFTENGWQLPNTWRK